MHSGIVTPDFGFFPGVCAILSVTQNNHANHNSRCSIAKLWHPGMGQLRALYMVFSTYGFMPKYKLESLSVSIKIIVSTCNNTELLMSWFLFVF